MTTTTKPRTANALRIARAQSALMDYALSVQQPPTAEETVIDLVTDLCHAARSYGYNVPALLDTAQKHFDVEA